MALVGLVNFLKLGRLVGAVVDRLRNRPAVVVITRALDAPARERKGGPRDHAEANTSRHG